MHFYINDHSNEGNRAYKYNPYMAQKMKKIHKVSPRRSERLINYQKNETDPQKDNKKLSKTVSTK